MSETVKIYRNRKSDVVFKEVKLILFQNIFKMIAKYGTIEKIFSSTDGIIVQFVDKTEIKFKIRRGSGTEEQPTIFFKLN